MTKKFLFLTIIFVSLNLYASQIATKFIQDDAVTNAKSANMATQTFKGRTTAGTGDPEDLTATQATAMLNIFTDTLKGLVPLSGGGTTNFLRADGTWASPGGGGGANTFLSNLTSPTAVNEDLLMDPGNTIRVPNNTAYRSRNSGNTLDIDIIKLDSSNRTTISSVAGTNILFDNSVIPSASNTFNNGISAVPWADVNSNKFTFADGSVFGELNGSGTTPSGVANTLGFRSTAGKVVSVFTSNGTSSADHYYETGNASAGDSGSMHFKTGTATGNRGFIEFDAADFAFNATNGILLSTSGGGITLDSSASDINIQNSNPGNTTVNGGNNTLVTSQNGNTTVEALTGEVILLGTGVESINATTRQTKDASGNKTYDYSQRQFFDQNGDLAIIHTADARELKNTSEVTTVDWEAATLRFVSGIIARWGNITNNPSSWGSDFPGIEIDGTSSAATTAGGSGISLLSTSSAVYLMFTTTDLSTASTTSGIFTTTGNNDGTGGSGTLERFTGSTVDAPSGSFNESSGNSTNSNSGSFFYTTGGAANGDSGGFNFNVGVAATPGQQGMFSITAKRLEVDAGIRPSKLTADPCGDALVYPEGTLFYNDTSDYFCFCNGAGDDVQMHAPAVACF